MFTSRKTKTLAMAAGAVVLGGIGTATIAGAQTTDDDATTEVESTEQSDNNTDAERGERGNREGRGEDGNRRGCGKSLETMAGIIGIEPEELEAALEDGQSLADVAEANGVDSDALVDALVANAEEKIESKVEAGRLTEAEGAEKLAEKTERIEDRVAGVEQADDEAVEGEGS